MKRERERHHRDQEASVQYRGRQNRRTHERRMAHARGVGLSGRGRACDTGSLNRVVVLAVAAIARLELVLEELLALARTAWATCTTTTTNLCTTTIAVRAFSRKIIITK
jgi:hypothetical protein